MPRRVMTSTLAQKNTCNQTCAMIIFMVSFYFRNPYQELDSPMKSFTRTTLIAAIVGLFPIFLLALIFLVH